MVTEKTQANVEGNQEQEPDEFTGESWARNTEEQLFGKEDQETPSKVDKQTPDLTNVPLEILQQSPIVQDLQGKADRQGNVIKALHDQLNLANESLKTFRTAEMQTLLSQLGDTPENRALIADIINVEAAKANLALREQALAPIQKQQTCSEIMRDYSIPETSSDGTVNYRNLLMQSKSPEEMEIKGQSMKELLATLPKGQPAGTKLGAGKGTTQGKGVQGQRQPAMSHTPDKALGSVAPQSFEQIEELYIAGKLEGGYAAYAAAAKKAGVKLE